MTSCIALINISGALFSPPFLFIGWLGHQQDYTKTTEWISMTLGWRVSHFSLPLPLRDGVFLTFLVISQGIMYGF